MGHVVSFGHALQEQYEGIPHVGSDWTAVSAMSSIDRWHTIGDLFRY
jgi:hypothetical protein